MHLTKSEQQIMEIFWQADHAMAQTEVVKTCVDRKWKERSIFSMLNSLMEKGVLREVGFVRSGKTYARTFEPAMSHAEYLASVIAEQLPAKQLPELIAALMQKVETTPAIQKEMRAASSTSISAILAFMPAAPSDPQKETIRGRPSLTPSRFLASSRVSVKKSSRTGVPVTTILSGCL